MFKCLFLGATYVCIFVWKVHESNFQVVGAI